MKALSDQVWIRNQCFCFFKLLIFIFGFSVNVSCAFLVYIIQWKNLQKQILLEWEKRRCIFHILDQIKISRVKRELHCLCMEGHLKFRLKGVTGNVWYLNWECSIVETFFKIPLRLMRCFYGAYLFSERANSIFETLIDCSFWRARRDDFENRFFFNSSRTTTKNVTSILQ